MGEAQATVPSDSVRPLKKMILAELDRAHPAGEIFLTSASSPTEVGHTERVMCQGASHLQPSILALEPGHSLLQIHNRLRYSQDGRYAHTRRESQETHMPGSQQAEGRWGRGKNTHQPLVRELNEPCGGSGCTHPSNVRHDDNDTQGPRHHQVPMSRVFSRSGRPSLCSMSITASLSLLNAMDHPRRGAKHTTRPCLVAQRHETPQFKVMR